MSRLQLPSITLCLIDCLTTERSIKVLDHCKKMCDFGDVKFLSSIPNDYPHWVKIQPLNSLIAYSIFMLKDFYKYIDTERCLIVQRDGWILNPQSWNPEWLKNDYTAPLFMQMDRVGSGGCSLRSKRIMEAVSKSIPDWNGTQKDAERVQRLIPFYEDGMLSLTTFSKDFKIATLEEGADFGQGGNRTPLYFRERPFSFHRTWQKIDFKTGVVDSSDLTKDIHVTYDHEIDAI